MTLDDFIQKYNKQKIDFDGAYGGQCVDLFRQYNQEVLKINQPRGVLGAADFWTNYETDSNLNNNFDKIPNTLTLLFKKGDVAIWNKKAGGGYGHIAVVSDDKATTSTFNSFDQNWKTISVCELISHNYTNLYGVLRPKKSQDLVCHSKEKNDELITKATWYDEHYQDYQDLQTKKTDFTQFKKTVEQRLETLAANLGSIIDWDEVVNASARFKQMDENNLALQAELEKQAESNKAVVSEFENKLSSLKLEMLVMKDDYEKKIDNIEARVDKEIADLQKAKEQYETTNRFISWVKKLLGK